MAGIFFTSGENKKRAGVYQRYINVGTPEIAGASDGIVAAVLRSNWGEFGKVKTFNNYDSLVAEYGTGGNNGTVSILREVFNGGAKQVSVIRLGKEGTVGKDEINDGSEPNVPAITITAKYSGDRDFRYAVRESLSDESLKEFVVYENGVLIEKIPFSANNQREVNALIEAGEKSAYFVFSKKSDYTGVGEVVAITPEKEFPKGSVPEITNADYSDAFNALEPYEWNAIVVDTTDVAVHQLLVNFTNRIYDNGKLGFAVIGEPVSVDFETRLSHARNFNNYKVVYVGGGFATATEQFDGAKAAARVAGMVASVPSGQSLTHYVVNGATEPLEMLTNYQYEQAIDSGMITFSTGINNSVWVEKGITTLVTPSGEDDEGWKKIKRTKVRFELMNRVEQTVSPLVGRVNNNDDGRATVLQAVQGLLNTMVSEGKLLSGAFVEIDENNPPVADSAWFNIQADDVDSLEKIYFVYKFRYAEV